jgi:two-component system response regulator
VIEILLVEDSPSDAELAVEALREAKVEHELAVVTDGVEAMAYLRQEGEYAGASHPDLVLLDLNLPRKDGREVLMEIRAAADLKQIPVAVLTTSRKESDILNAYRLGANCYITKPVLLEEFLKVMSALESFWLTIVQLPPKQASTL